MNRIKKIMYFLIITILLFSTISCSNSQADYISNTRLGLIINSFQEYDGWVYYLEDGNLYRTKPDGNEKTQICNDIIYSFEVYENRIYYINGNDFYGYSIKIDGSDKKVILTNYEATKISKMDFIDDWIYLIPLGGSLCKIKTDGTGFTRLDDRIIDINIDREWIYYFYMVPEEVWVYQLWRMHTDGTQKQQLMQTTSHYIDYQCEWIYYVGEETKSIYKVGFDGKEKHKIIECGNGTEIKVIGDWLFYHDPEESPGIYKIKTDGSEHTKIADETSINFIDIWDNWLICSGDKISIIRVSDLYDTDEIIMEIISDWPNVKIYE